MTSKVSKVWQAIPLKLVFFLTAVSLWAGEFYPFSDYPMYSQFKGTEYYLYFADQNDEPIPSKSFHTTAPKLKKRFKGRLKDQAKAEDAKERELSDAGLEKIGRETLKSFLKEADPMPQLRELRLVLVYVDYDENGAIVKTSKTIAKLPFKP
jgi:hypothetical protein